MITHTLNKAIKLRLVRLPPARELGFPELLYIENLILIVGSAE
jgi:hypothetical protein